MIPKALTLVLLCFFCFASATSKYAYVTIHYEGTERDDEYVLGVRTLIKSIQLTGSKNDIIVLASPNVRPKTVETFQKDGARVKFIENIANPYKDDIARRKYYQSRFDGTLNKLHIWNLTDYERVLYLDADTVILHNVDELFHCGHFCAAYMNVLAFHTAVMVAKPDPAKLDDMLKNLATLNSYDGADQGFFVSYFHDLDLSPYFDPANGVSEAPMNRLWLGYSMNHIYYYEKSGWNHGYRVNIFKDWTIPASILTYPIAPVFKPWYWPGYIWLDLHWVWNSYRSHLNEDWSAPVILITLFLVAILTAATYLSRRFVVRENLNTKYRWLFALGWSMASLYFVFMLIPLIMPPSIAIPLFFASQSVLYYFIGTKFFTLYGGHEMNFTNLYKMISLELLISFFMVQLSGYPFVSPVFRVLGAFTCILSFPAMQSVILLTLIGPPTYC